MKKLAACIIVASAPLLGSAALAPVPYPPPAVSLVLTPSTVAPGGTFTATFNGCTAGQVVTFTLTSDSESATCAASAVVTLTAPRAAGTYTVTATSPTASATATLTVRAPAPAPSGALPSTGSDSAPIAQIAGGVLLAGIGLASVAFYRRRSSTAAS